MQMEGEELCAKCGRSVQDHVIFFLEPAPPGAEESEFHYPWKGLYCRPSAE